MDKYEATALIIIGSVCIIALAFLYKSLYEDEDIYP